ncbi:Hemogen, partial [Podiceps cristatus]
ITHRLRDRELLRKRKAEAQEKDSAQWVLREQKRNKRQRRGKGAKRGQACQVVVQPRPEPELERDPQPDTEKAGPAPSKLAPPEKGQEEPSLPIIQGLGSGMQAEPAEGKLADSSQDPAGEEELLNLAEGGIPEALNIPLENEYEDNGYSAPVLF